MHTVTYVDYVHVGLKQEKTCADCHHVNMYSMNAVTTRHLSCMQNPWHTKITCCTKVDVHVIHVDVPLLMSLCAGNIHLLAKRIPRRTSRMMAENCQLLPIRMKTGQHISRRLLLSTLHQRQEHHHVLAHHNHMT